MQADIVQRIDKAQAGKFFVLAGDGGVGVFSNSGMSLSEIGIDDFDVWVDGLKSQSKGLCPKQEATPRDLFLILI